MPSRSRSYKAGTASVCITPDGPLWLAGYASRSAPARGTISDLYATALALEDEAGQLFVVASMDLIAITRAVADRVADAMRAQHGLSRRQLLLAATHTHYAPEFRADKQLFFHIPDEYGAMLPAVFETLVAALTQVVGQALQRLEPARLLVRQTTTGFAHNRRRHGVVAGTPSTADVVDHDVPVLDCVDAAGHRNAIVFGYACHNLTIPAEDLRYCADWAGFARQELQQRHPAAMALFLPGAGADQDPEPRGSVELSRQYGRQIAGAVLTALEGPGREITGPIRTAREEVPLSLEPVTRESLSKMLASDDPPQQVKARFLRDQLARAEKLMTSYTAPIQVVRFGNELLMIALSGEPAVDWAVNSKRELASLRFGGTAPLIWVCGYSNDMFGYLPTRRVQAEGGYEGGRATLWSAIPAPFTEDVEDKVTAAVRRLVERVSR